MTTDLAIRVAAAELRRRLVAAHMDEIDAQYGADATGCGVQPEPCGGCVDCARAHAAAYPSEDAVRAEVRGVFEALLPATSSAESSPPFWQIDRGCRVYATRRCVEVVGSGQVLDPDGAEALGWALLAAAHRVRNS